MGRARGRGSLFFLALFCLCSPVDVSFGSSSLLHCPRVDVWPFPPLHTTWPHKSRSPVGFSKNHIIHPVSSGLLSPFQPFVLLQSTLPSTGVPFVCHGPARSRTCNPRFVSSSCWTTLFDNVKRVSMENIPTQPIKSVAILPLNSRRRRRLMTGQSSRPKTPPPISAY